MTNSNVVLVTEFKSVLQLEIQCQVAIMKAFLFANAAWANSSLIYCNRVDTNLTALSTNSGNRVLS